MIYNPYRIERPGIVSFSGGRTSAFMLAKVVEAYGGALPSDIVPVFCNTGLEHAATYAFVADVSKRIAPVVWLEYRRTESGPSFAEVCDSDDPEYSSNPWILISGFHYVNRVFYILTEVPWTDEEEYLYQS